MGEGDGANNPSDVFVDMVLYKLREDPKDIGKWTKHCFCIASLRPANSRMVDGDRRAVVGQTRSTM